MSVQVADLSSLNTNAVAANLSFISTLVQNVDSTIEVRRGPFFDLVLYYSAVLATANQVNMYNARQANSLQAVVANPALADPGVVDTILQNWRITRIQGAEAAGSIVIVLNAPLVVSIPAGSIFTYGQLTYTADNTFTSALTQAQVVNPTTTKLLTQTTNGDWQFTITVTASAIGSIYNLSAGTLLISTLQPTGFIKSYAGSDISGGLDTETNTELIARFTDGGGAKAWSNRATAAALVSAQPGFTSTVMSIVGFGDPEMLRDEHSLWPGNYGGRVDVWSRTQQPLGTATMTYTATLVSKTGPVGTWQFSVAKDDLPGFYYLPQVVLTGNLFSAATFTITSDVRGYDLSGPGFIPDIITYTEAAYTRYQTATIKFVDTITDASSLIINTSTQLYDVQAFLMPNIAELNDFLIGRQIISPAGDLLVRAPVPCFMNTTIVVQRTTGDPAPDISTVQQAVASAINAVQFGGQVTAALIAAGVTPYLMASNVVTTVTMSGTIRRVDGTLISIGPDTNILTFTSDPANLVTARTVGFYQDAAAVTVTLVEVPTPPI